VAEVRAEIPLPDGWQFVCTTISREVDGLTDPNKKVVTLYFGDAEDTTAEDKFSIAHEIAHTWQNELGMWTADSDDKIACREQKDPQTGQIMADPLDWYAPFCRPSLEHQADNFALAHGYRSSNPDHHASYIGARSICRYFEQFRDDLC
jgi:hypothetical protein